MFERIIRFCVAQRWLVMLAVLAFMFLCAACFVVSFVRRQRQADQVVPV